MQEIDKVIFNENLLLTQYFCAQRLLNCDKNAASIFRSINPIYDGKKLFEFKMSDYFYEPETRYSFVTEWTQDPLISGSKLYNQLFDFQLLQKREKIKGPISSQKFNGKILIAEIDGTVTDGASEVCSDGLVDVYDCPPIDTWFYLSHNSTGRNLYAWIPKEFVYNASKAIEVNCVDCLHWYDV